MMESLGQVDAPVSPLRWYPACLVVSPDRWAVWLGARNIGLATPTSPLPLGGLLVLGQDQDELDGGYTAAQSFLGQVTGLTLWGSGLEPQEIRAFGRCESLETGPLVSWPDLSWTLYNQTGSISATSASPCDSSDQLLLFTTHLSWSEAHAYLASVGLELAVPRSHREVRAVSRLIRGSERLCGVASGKGTFGWIGATANRSTDVFYDAEGEEVRILSEYKGPEFSARPADAIYALQSALGYIDLSSSRRIACSAGRQRQPIKFRLRGKCEFLEDFGDSFILSSGNASGVYFHGYGRLLISRDEATSLWCLLEGPASEPDAGRIACTASAQLPLGERPWTLLRDACGRRKNDSISLVLTRCTDDQYTCRDASCIDLKQMCDHSFDCPDKKDESACVTAHLGEGYEASVAPNLPLNMTAFVAVVNVREFDLLSMAFEVHLSLEMLWHDPWITFSHLASAGEKAVTTQSEEEVGGVLKAL